MGAGRREVAIWLKAVNKMGPGVREAAADLKSVERAGTQMFKKIAAAGAAAIAALTAGAVGIGASFEQGLANTSSMFITAAKDSKELAVWTGQLEQKARALGASTAFSAREATDAMYALASGGLSVGQTIEASDAVLKLAGATMTDMASAAELTMSSMKQFGLQASDADRITNVFAAGIQNSMLNMERLSNAMVYAGPTASALGMSIEQTTAALALLHNAGLKGSIAGTGLRMAFARLMDPSKQLKEVLHGVSVEKDGLGAVLERLKDANLSASQMTEMFGARAFNAISALTKAGKEGFDAMTKSLTGTNAASDMYAHQMDTVQNQTKILKSAVEETFIAIFKVIAPTLRQVLGILQSWVAETRPLLVGFFQQLVETIQNAMQNYVRPFFAFLQQNRATVISIAKSIGVAVAALWGVSYALRAILLLMNMTKATWIGAIATVVIAGVTFLVEKMGGWQAAWIKVQKVGKATGIWLRGFWERAKLDVQLFVDFIMALPSNWKTALSTIADIVMIWYQTIGQVFLDIGKIIMQPWKAGELWDELTTNFQNGFQALKDAAVQGVTDILGEETIQAHKDAKDALKLELAEDFADLDAWYSEQMANVGAGAGGSGGGGGGRAVPQMDPALAAAMMGMPYISPEMLEGVPEDPVATAQATADGVFKVYEELGTGLQNQASSAWNTIIDSSRTGSEKWKAIWSSSSKFIWGLLGKTVMRKLMGDKIMLASDTATNSAQQANNTKTAASGFFKAYAGMPFIGQALALAAIGFMIGFLGKMHTGGMIGGPNASGSFSEVPFIGQRGEFVMPVQQTREYLPLLEAMRSGNAPALSAAGAGGPSLSVHVSVAEGSLILADDELAVRRFAEKIADVTKERIDKAYYDPEENA